MTKSLIYLLALLHAAVSSDAVVCEGDSSNSCNGLVNTCTSEGLCVIDISTGNCCEMSKPYGWNSCTSNETAEVCEGEMGVTYVEDEPLLANETAAITSSPTSFPTEPPTFRPTKLPTSSPTISPTPRPTTSPTMSSPPSETCYNIEIGLIFDKYPDETKWEITKGRRNSIERENAEVVKKSPRYDSSKGYVEASEKHIICLPEGKYTFTVMDKNKDGICCGKNGEGRYALTYQETGEIITHGGEFKQYESTIFDIPFVTPTLRDADGDGIEDRTKNVIPSLILSSNVMPKECDNEFGLHLETDDYGVETTWELRERSATGNYEDGKVVASGGPYTSDFIYDISYCLYPGKYTFVFYDWHCDGLTGEESTGYYALKINDSEVYRGGTTMDDYWEEVKLEFTKGGESINTASSTEESRARSSWVRFVMTISGAAVMMWN
mmetsp:Transcript_34321/g.72289  ORF Transcript_34321/g.72289 Transcript_34321/m.72289 type:complete len:438 (-) Transcript_34321:158-1471(-)